MTRTRRRRRLTLRTRLALWYGGAVALTGVLLVAVTTAAAVTALMTSPPQGSEDLDSTTNELFLVITGTEGSESPDPSPAATDGSVIGSTSGAPDDLYSSLREAVAAENHRIRSQVLDGVLVWSAAALVLVVILAAALGWLIAARALAPLRLMAATAHRVAGDNLGERIALDGPDDEVKDLADTFDAMLERLDQSFDAQRRFVANASHELRTPLTINRTVLEVALADPDASADLREVGRSLLDVNARHERLIEGLLTLASADSGPELTDDVNLADLVEIAASRALPGADLDRQTPGPGPGGDAGGGTPGEEAGEVGPGGDAGEGPHRQTPVSSPRLLLDLDPAVVVAGNELLLERLVQNLVDNAVRYNVPDGSVRVHVARDGADAVLTVENTGPVVPPEEAESLFEPFRRLNPSGGRSDRNTGYVKGGLGLGLSIVRSVVRAHAGTVTATPREGGGLRLEVRLPGV